MISGYTKIGNDKSLFEYKNKVIHVRYEGEKILDNSFDILKCKKFPNYNDIYFYTNSSFLFHYGVCEYYPDLVFDFKNEKSDIFAIDFELDEIDAFYDINLTDACLDSFAFNGEMRITARSFDETDSDKYNINIRNKNMMMQIVVGKSYESNSSKPFSFTKKIRVEYDFKDDYSLIYETINDVKRFVSIIAYRKNIIFKKISIQSRNQNQLLNQVGTIEYIDKTFIERRTDTGYIEDHSYFYDNIRKNMGTLFNKISTNEIDILNIPKDDYMINIYNEERILMIASTFEDLFALIYDNKITHREASIKMRNYFSDFLITNEDKLELKNQNYRDFWDKLKKYVEFDNYSSKLNEVLKKDDFINGLIKSFYETNGKPYTRYLITERIETIRNKCAHGEYRKIAENNDLYCIKALELIVYYLQLKYIGVDVLNINVIMYRVFRISVSSDTLKSINV